MRHGVHNRGGTNLNSTTECSSTPPSPWRDNNQRGRTVSAPRGPAAWWLRGGGGLTYLHLQVRLWDGEAFDNVGDTGDERVLVSGDTQAAGCYSHAQGYISIDNL